MLLRLALRLTLVATLAGSAGAQLLNRAIWLGSEEGLRRTYRQDAEYFIDRASYVDAPPWWRAGPIDPFQSRVSFSGGSVNSSDLTLESSTQVGVALGSGYTFRAQQLGSENQGNRFQRFGVGLDMAVADETSLILQLEGDAAKARADLSLGVEILRTEHSAHRFLVTLADWSDGKSLEFEYDTKPYGLMLAGFHGEADGVQVVYDLSTQLPLEEREIDTGTVFELQRTIALAELRIPLGVRDKLVLGFDGESSSRDNLPTDLASIELESGSVERARVRADWWRSPASGYDTSLGFWLHRLDEDSLRPNDSAEDRVVRRREFGLTGRMRVPMTPKWSLEPYVLAGHVDFDDRAGTIEDSRESEGFEGKFGTPLVFRFSDTAFIRVDLSMQLDQFAFGGGGVQLQMTF